MEPRDPSPALGLHCNAVQVSKQCRVSLLTERGCLVSSLVQLCGEQRQFTVAGQAGQAGSLAELQSNLLGLPYSPARYTEIIT